MADLTGKDIGRYHIIEALGQGGMAEVYKAHDKRLDRQVALKVIRKDAIPAALHEEMLKRFEREARSLARLSHPNIVKVYDFGEYNDSPYLVMEYLTGGTLKQKATGRVISWSEAARLLAPVARALEYAHEEGVLHRDVKPANILLARRDMPMLSDFGIAKIMDTDVSTQLTGTNAGIGTPEYMAPEQWLGRPVAQTDIYALGVVFYELVTGRRPYTADTPAAVMLKQATDPLPRPRLYAPDLPDAVEHVLFTALAKKPEDRYASMADMAAALERLASGAATVAVSPPAQPEQPATLPSFPPSIPEAATALPPAAVETVALPPKQPPTVAMPTRLILPDKKIPRRRFPRLAVGLVVAGFAFLSLLAALAWNGWFSPALQAARTSTAEALAYQQTREQAAALAALWTATSTLTVPPSRTATPMPTPTSLVTATPQAGDSRVAAVDNMRQVWVSAGEFSMGYDQGNANERPVHAVFLDGFWIDRTEVTNKFYALCVEAGACTPPSNTSSATRPSYYGNSPYDYYPVIYVSWKQAQAYCQWAGRQLPTEAQWEKAARGKVGWMYPWGNADPSSVSQNFNDRIGDTMEVGKYPGGASPYGALDMAGNVWEWVADWYSDSYYATSPANNPTGPAGGSYRSVRGGSGNNFVRIVRMSYRYWFYPDENYDHLGFRCASLP